MSELVTQARPYAKAIFAYAKARNQLNSVSDTLACLVAIVTDKQVAYMLDNPAVSPNKWIDFIGDILGNRFDQSLKNFVLLLMENDRLVAMPAIFDVYQLLKAEAEKSLAVDMISAFEVTAAQVQRFTQLLSQKFGRAVELHCSVDKTLLGGAMFCAGDIVIDGSLKGKLSRLMYSLNQA